MFVIGSILSLVLASLAFEVSASTRADDDDLPPDGDGDGEPALPPITDLSVFNGTDGADHLMGTPGNDVIHGGAGDDDLRGGLGDDTILGGEGNDTLFGGPGNDWLSGNDGDDVLVSTEGSDDLDGGRGNDVLIGHDGPETVWMNGGEGDDTLMPGAHDFASGNAGADTFVLRQIPEGFPTIADFDSAEDQIVLHLSETLAMDALLGLREDEDGTFLIEVNGEPVGRLLQHGGLRVEDIRVVPVRG